MGIARPLLHDRRCAAAHEQEERERGERSEARANRSWVHRTATSRVHPPVTMQIHLGLAVEATFEPVYGTGTITFRPVDPAKFAAMASTQPPRAQS